MLEEKRADFELEKQRKLQQLARERIHKREEQKKQQERRLRKQRTRTTVTRSGASGHL